MAKISNAVVLAVLICVSNGFVCKNENPCLCELDDYNKIDLSQVTSKEEFLNDGTLQDLHETVYFFHGCKDGDFNATAHGISVNDTKKLYPGSLIQVAVDPVNNIRTNVTVLGKSNDIKFSAIEGEKDSYQIIYAQSKNGSVSAAIRLVCANVGSSFIKFLAADGTSLSLALTSSHACVITNHPRLSTGSVFLIIFFITFGVYFIGGCAVLYLMRGARGLEMIPNIDFWRSLPGLVKDGVIFLFSGCSASSITTPETYDRI